ncbi:MAG: FkbM family methyltransferase [Actinobacteria bacterium]|nr:FkbM family methyltransferase [Actinomycetota bacterium]
MIRSYALLARTYGPRAFLLKSINAVLVRPGRRLLFGSYSESNEDRIVEALLGRKKDGFYVDIGANDPKRANNTMRFYKRGWSGIVIEPNESCCLRFQAARPRDIVLNIGISQVAGRGSFFRFFPDTRSTLSKECADRLVKKGFWLVSSSEIELQPLADVLKEHAGGRTIDFMSIDTEGYDKQVLLSNDWERFRPSVICVESGDESVTRLLSDLGYLKVATTKDNSIYMQEERYEQSQRHCSQLSFRKKTH